MKTINVILKDFALSKRKVFFFPELLKYAKARNVSLDKADLEEIVSIGDNVAIIELISDSELIQSITQKGERYSESSESDSKNIENYENISPENLIEVLNKDITGLERRAYISEDEISSLVKIKDKVVKNKPSILQKKLDDL